MKKLILTTALLLGFNTAAQSATTCTNDDLIGQWSVKYIVSSSAFVGTCNIVFDGNMVTSGTCDNIGDTETSEIFDGLGTISKRCGVTGKMTFNNAARMSVATKMTADKQYMTGTFSSNTGGKVSKGKITLQKTGELSCSVVSKE